jgi:DNA polymerase III delta subunit
MLHVFFGNNTIAVRNKAYAFAMPYEEDGVKLVRIDADSYQQGMIVDIAGSMSLFGEKSIYLIDTPSVSADFYEEVTGLLSALKDSANTFVVIESSLLAAPKKLFTKHADSIEEITADKASSFNVFALADSLSRKDKKTLWLGLCDAKRAGSSSEEIIGTLWWQMKTLRLASLTRSASEAGMKDFPYSKAKRSLSAFKRGEIEALSASLLALYHEGHMGETDIDYALEKWTLSI